MIIAGRNINRGARFTPVVNIGFSLSRFNIGENTVNDFANILVRVADVPLRNIIIILRTMKTASNDNKKSNINA